MRAIDTDRIINQLAASQHGLVTVSQLLERGVHHDVAARRARSGRLLRVDHGVYRVAGAAVTWDQRALVHCLAAGPLAVLSHRAAAMAWGLTGFRAAPFELLVPRHIRRHPRPGAILHESLTLADVDRSTRSGLPVTSVVRTIIDLPAVTSPRRTDEAFEDALARRLCTVDQVLDRFVQIARRGRPGTRVMRQLLEKRSGRYVPTQSVFEHRLLPLIEQAGLPAPVRQHPVAVRDTTVFLDFAWPLVRVAVECDGVFFHGRTTRLPWDDDRQNELVLRGWTILRVTWDRVHEQPELVVSQLRAGYTMAAAARRRALM